MKKLLIAIILTTLSLSTVACSSSKQSSSTSSSSSTVSSLSTLESIKKDGVIKIGTEGTYAPFTFHDSSNKLVGYDVEVAEAVAEKLGVKVEFIETKWDSLIAGLDVNQYQAVFNEVTINDDRKKKYDFTEPYSYSHAGIILKNDNDSIKTVADLKGKKSAQSVSSNYAKAATDAGAEIVPVDGFAEAIELVNTGRADATLNDDVTYYDYMKSHPKAPLKVIEDKTSITVNAAIINKNEAELKEAIDKALKDLQSEGKLKDISMKYFGKDISVDN